MAFSIKRVCVCLPAIVRTYGRGWNRVAKSKQLHQLNGIICVSLSFVDAQISGAISIGILHSIYMPMHL